RPTPRTPVTSPVLASPGFRGATVAGRVPLRAVARTTVLVRVAPRRMRGRASAFAAWQRPISPPVQDAGAKPSGSHRAGDYGGPGLEIFRNNGPGSCVKESGLVASRGAQPALGRRPGVR